jgi:hypothetical protein
MCVRIHTSLAILRSSSSYEETDRTVKDSVKFNVFVDKDNILKADLSKNQFTIYPNQRQQ